MSTEERLRERLRTAEELLTNPKYGWKPLLKDYGDCPEAVLRTVEKRYKEYENLIEELYNCSNINNVRKTVEQFRNKK
jgi:hypothetical protein